MNDTDITAPPEGWADLRFTTAWLEASIAHGGLGPAYHLHPRQAAALLPLDTAERRQRAYWEANTLQNLQGGILSGCMWAAVSQLQRMVANGTEDQEMYAEGAARRARETEAEMRKTRPGAIYYPPEMRRA